MTPVKFKDSIFHRILSEEIPGVKADPASVRAHCGSISSFISALPAEAATFAYAPGKWSVAQVLGHLVDTQIVFLYRLVCVARGEPNALPGFDEGIWVGNAQHGQLPIREIGELYSKGSAFLLCVLDSLPAGSLVREGLANGVAITGEEILIYMQAHEDHHVRILKERYTLSGRALSDR